jgi:alpha-D-xyloside xylohydrolase
VYKRWCAFGLLSSHSRLHGSSYRVPWLYEEDAASKDRQRGAGLLHALKCRLMPYLFGQRWKPTSAACR